MPKTLKNKNRNKRSQGGRRKSRKGGPSTWTSKVTELYRKMKKEDSSVSFRDALVKASALKKKGQL
jgi:RNA polymerase-interacting CarD/CdnL/TRCF family regulator